MPEITAALRRSAVGPALVVSLLLGLVGPAAALAATGSESDGGSSVSPTADGRSGRSTASEAGADPAERSASEASSGPVARAEAERREGEIRRTARSSAAGVTGSERLRDDAAGNEDLHGAGEAIRRSARERVDGMSREARKRLDGTQREVREQIDALRSDARDRADAIRRDVRDRADAVRRRASAGGGERGQTSRRSSSSEAAEADMATVSIASAEQIRLIPGNKHIQVRHRAVVSGYIPSGRVDKKVVLEVLQDGHWVAVASARTVEDGRFDISWYPSRPGRYRVRVRRSSTTTNPLPSDTRRLYVYRTAVASWYGPGFYGRRTACGQTFTDQLMGVAHKTLPCGYLVTVRYHGRDRTVPVVDRGPYVDGRDYDLTEALRNYLGFDGVDEIQVTA